VTVTYSFNLAGYGLLSWKMSLQSILRR